MVQIDGTYVNDRNENFLEFLVKVGIPEDRAKQAVSDKGKLTLKVDGKKFWYKYEGTVSYETSLVEGEQVEELMFTGQKGLSTTKVEGNVVKIRTVEKSGKGEMDRVYTFTDSGLEVTLSSQNVKAKRFYKRV